MQGKTPVVRAVVVCAALLLLATAASAADMWIGTWKLNVAKSVFSPGPAPKSQTLTFEVAQGGIKLSSETVGADGATTRGTYVGKFDGTAVPWAGNPDADTATPKRIDDSTYENVWTKGGKVTMTAKATVSKDGKTLTITQTGTNAQGKPVNNVVVLERQ